MNYAKILFFYILCFFSKKKPIEIGTIKNNFCCFFTTTIVVILAKIQLFFIKNKYLLLKCLSRLCFIMKIMFRQIFLNLFYHNHGF